ncbi:hypothetical protein [Novosphingobium album (ex Hu et al. 2023)]|uniref:MBL fold metallo-hydrolase n=1 Tax=Novosphingobium album (ex Hu et al. 2023) TaxID=2930093 RepID=A0ABT0AYW6_9SPHN|nr:hypothetical protein [Novosphingobium album (ex Hu et al. 2023)]MCJ2177992.1 hypothetical protein [Novosphingobium album (ex Hu et al. 2023)]
MTRRLNYWLLACIAIISFPYYWYLMDDPASAGVGPKAVTMTELRKLADTLEGPRPGRVRSELVGHCRIMRNRLVAGWGLRPIPIAVWSYELTVPGKTPIVIDAGVTRATAESYGIADYDSAAQRRVDRVRARAAHTVVLSDSALHTGNLHLGQQHNTNTAPYPLAPGVVVLPAPGLGPHAKLVYVRLQNGREFLFTGPAARVKESLNALVPPARLTERDDVPDAGTETKSWLMTINALRRAAPDMTVITAHESVATPHVSKWFSDHS